MSSTDVRYPAAEGRVSPPIVTPHYGSSLPNPPTDIEDARRTRCATGIKFLTSLHGILNIILIVSRNVFIRIEEFIEYFRLHLFV